MGNSPSMRYTTNRAFTRPNLISLNLVAQSSETETPVAAIVLSLFLLSHMIKIAVVVCVGSQLGPKPWTPQPPKIFGNFWGPSVRNPHSLRKNPYVGSDYSSEELEIKFLLIKGQFIHRQSHNGGTSVV